MAETRSFVRVSRNNRVAESRATPHERAAEEFARRVGEWKGDAVSAVLLYERGTNSDMDNGSFSTIPPTRLQKRTKYTISHTT